MRARFSLSTRSGVLVGALLLAGGLSWMARIITAVRAADNVAVVSVNAASFAGPLAPGAIAAAFGAGLATHNEAAQHMPLPTSLAGTTVKLLDSRSIEHALPLFFVSPGQLNYLIPDGVAIGAAQLTITSGAGEVSRGEVQLFNSSPAIFTASYKGRGLPVALTTYDGLIYESVVNADGTPRAVDPGAVWRPNYLLLFGTGLRHATNLRARIGNTEVTPIYAGAQGLFAGLDQVNLPLPPNLPGGMAEITLTSDGRTSNTVQLRMAGNPEQTLPAPFVALTVADVQTVIAQAVARAQQLNLRATIAVVSREGDLLGVFKMTGARVDVKLGATNLLSGRTQKPADPDGLNEVVVPFTDTNGSCVVPSSNPLRPLLCDGAALAALSKAGTAGYFSTSGNAFSTRTASFIIQEHIPPLVDFTPGGLLFGVQFSQLPCSDMRPPGRILPFGLAGDPGGVPIYKNGLAAGGVGVELDGFYSVDIDPSDNDQAVEESIAAATQGFETPAAVRGDQIVVDGIRLPFVNAALTNVQAQPFSSLSGVAIIPPQATAASVFTPLTLGGVPGRVDAARFFPFKDSSSTNPNKLTATDVNRIITQAAQQAYRTRAAIRRPLGSPAEVNISVVDTGGAVLGLFSTIDASIFGFDVSVQKARTAASSAAPPPARNCAASVRQSPSSPMPQPPMASGSTAASPSATAP